MLVSDEIRHTQQLRPTGTPVMHNRWTDLLFLHWRFAPALVQKWLPPGLRVDCFDDSAWVGVVPFGMERIRPIGCPPVPGLSWFLELNLRTYVIEEATGIPGVWFFSLDASQWLACQVARRAFHLPYFHARMKRQHQPDGTIHYTSQCSGEAACTFQYLPAKSTAQGAEMGSLDYFLLERYVLFSWNASRKSLSIGRVHHAPYQVVPVEVNIASAAPLFQRAGLDAPSEPAVHTTFASRVQTLIFPLEKRSP